MDVLLRLCVLLQTLEARVDVQVLAYRELRVDRGELWTDPERESGLLGVPDDGAAVDEDLACVREDVAACGRGQLSVHLRDNDLATKETYESC